MKPCPVYAARATARRGATTGLVVTILLSVGLGLFLLWFRISGGDANLRGTEASSSADTTARRAPGSNLPVTVSVCRRSGDSLRTEGYVRNAGGVIVRYVQVELTWSDASGNPVDTHITYAIGGEVFTPGDSIAFGAATGEGAATDCEASLFDYEPL